MRGKMLLKDLGKLDGSFAVTAARLSCYPVQTIDGRRGDDVARRLEVCKLDIG